MDDPSPVALNARSPDYASPAALDALIMAKKYAFPMLMTRLEPVIPGLVALHDLVTQRPNVAAHLASKRHLPFSEDGISVIILSWMGSWRETENNHDEMARITFHQHRAIPDRPSHHQPAQNVELSPLTVAHGL